MRQARAPWQRPLAAVLAAAVGTFALAVGAHVPAARPDQAFGQGSGAHRAWHRHSLGTSAPETGRSPGPCAACLAQRGSRADLPNGPSLHPAGPPQGWPAPSPLPVAASRVPWQPPSRAPPDR